MSPSILMKVDDFVRVICVIRVLHVVGCEVIAVHMGLVADAGLSSRTCSVVGIHLVVGPLGAAQEAGFQRRVQGKEGLDQLGLRLWMEGSADKITTADSGYIYMQKITGLSTQPDNKERSGRRWMSKNGIHL